MVKMSDPNAECSSSDFSVISHPPESIVVNGGIFLPNLQLSTISDPSFDDFKRQLQDLLQENTELKGALQQNMTIMRQHFGTLAGWQEKVGAATRRHKKILEELHREKQTHQTQLEQLAQKLESTEMELVKTKKESETSSRKSDEAMEVLRQEMDRQKQEMDEPRSSPPLLYVDEEDSGYTVVHHLPGTPVERSMRLQLQEEQERCSGLTQQLAQEQTKSSQLEKQLERSQSMSLESELEKASSFLKKYKDRCGSMDRWLGENQSKLESLVGTDSGSRLLEELQVLRSVLADEQRNREEDRKSLQQVKEKFEELQRDHLQLLHKWKNCQSEGRQTEVLRAIEKRQQQEQSDSLTAQLVVTQEELAAARQELDHLQSQSQMLQHDSEQIPILRAQAEIYQQDFEAERQGKERLEGELDRARKEIGSLHQLNMQLMDELSSTQQQAGRSPNHQSSRRRSRRESPTSTTAESGARMLQEFTNLEPCPKCKMAFSNVHALHNHIDKCLFEEGRSPYP